MKNLGIACLITCSLFLSSLSAKTFHLLILGDTSDLDIKYGVKRSMQIIEDTFSYVSSACKTDLRTIKLTTKQNLTHESIVKWIQNEKVAPDDVVILYYCGHGIRTYETPTIWPTACSSSNGDNFEFSEIIERLLLKRAALLLVLLDCCNEQIEPKDVPRIGVSPYDYITFDLKKIKEKRLIESCHELFFKPYGFIIASAASPEEIGRLHNQIMPLNARGGIFSKVFLNYFFQELDSQHPSWEGILKKTKKECIEETKKPKYEIVHSHYRHDYQTPQYKIFLHKRRRSTRVYSDYLRKHCKYDAKSFSPLFANAQQQTQSDTITELDSDVIEEGDVVLP